MVEDHDRIERERRFHDERFGNEDASRLATQKFYSVIECTLSYFTQRLASDCRGKRVLEYGCGVGEHALEWIRLGAQLTGIDISEEAVKRARAHAEQHGLQADYQVMNAERTTFPDNSFDYVVGSGILHHLELNTALAEVCRLLDVDGRAVFLEPWGHNPLINLYRRWTPSMRSVDEHPLLRRDLRTMRKYFGGVQWKSFCLTSLAAVPLRNTVIFRPLLRILNGVDRVLLDYVPFLDSLAWNMVIELSRPNKAAAAKSAAMTGIG